MHARPLSIGLNCALGASEMTGWLSQTEPKRDIEHVIYQVADDKVPVTGQVVSRDSSLLPCRCLRCW